MEKKTGFLDRFMVASGLPSENPGNVAIAELVGDRRVVIENHKGIVKYEKDSICVHVDFGVLSVSGETLSLTQMTRERLVISGNIRSVDLSRVV